MNVHLQHDMNYILLIDTSGSKTLVGLSRDGQCIRAEQHDDARSQAAEINGMVDKVCAAAGISLQELSAIAVCAGPGSYTGLRIGLATGKGLAYALNKPLLLHNRLELWAKQVQVKHENAPSVAMILTARENEYFVALYNAQGQELYAPKHLAGEELAAFIAVGNEHSALFAGDPAAVQALTGTIDLVATAETDPASWAAFADLAYQQQQFADLAHSEPFYMKEVFIHKPRS
jgi:tRNA threonylcarbamoyladenosine biosynthesis protein TsaB